MTSCIQPKVVVIHEIFLWRNNFIYSAAAQTLICPLESLHISKPPSISEGCDQLAAEQRKKKYCAIRSILQAETDNRASADYKIYYFQSTTANWENKKLRLSTRENYFRFFFYLFIQTSTTDLLSIDVTQRWWCHTSRHSSSIIVLNSYL